MLTSKSKSSVDCLSDIRYTWAASAGIIPAPWGPVIVVYCDTTLTSVDVKKVIRLEWVGETNPPPVQRYLLWINFPSSELFVKVTKTILIESASGQLTVKLTVAGPPWAANTISNCSAITTSLSRVIDPEVVMLLWVRVVPS